jgi:hypothetical protein
MNKKRAKSKAPRFQKPKAWATQNIPRRSACATATLVFHDYVDRTSRIAQFFDQANEILSHPTGPVPDRGKVLYPQYIWDLYFVDLADTDAIAESIEIPAVPTGGPDSLEESVIKIVGDRPAPSINDYLSHMTRRMFSSMTSASIGSF